MPNIHGDYLGRVMHIYSDASIIQGMPLVGRKLPLVEQRSQKTNSTSEYQKKTSPAAILISDQV